MDDEQKKKNSEADEAVEIDEKGELTEKKHIKKSEKPSAESGETGGSRWQRFLSWYKSNKKKSIPLTILVLVLLLAGVPGSRYQLAGLVLKKDLALRVTDSTAGTPVSGADISIGGTHATTNGSGKVTLKNIKVGPHTILVTKKYYQDSKTKVLVPILTQKSVPDIHFVATGRQVKISVKDLVSHVALADVDIKVADVSAKTDRTGDAVVVLPVGTASQKAALSLNGYNNATDTVKVSNSTIQDNDFMLTPAGKVYFLSKLSGKIDVVKTNLDGSGRQTVLAGTGKESDTGTILLASRDWKYLALLSTREGLKDNQGALASKLYLIDTSDDSVTTMDGDASVSISPVGWSEHNFVYSVNRFNVANNQSGKQALKSYDAESKKITLLDSTKGAPLGSLDGYKYEYYGSIYLIGKTVVYDKVWDIYERGNYVPVDDKAAIYSISATGGNSQTLKQFSYVLGQYTYINSAPYEAGQIYYQTSDGGAPEVYYAYSNGKISAKSDIADDFNQHYQQSGSTYLQSPNGNSTFWSESRDGKNTLFVGDQNGENGKQIAILSDYQNYGWYTDDYLLVSKNASELYIIPKSGVKKDSDAIKVSDYHKPAQNFNGYGGGYGGL